MADELRHAPMREDFIRGSDMVSLMQGKWEELWKIKMGLLGRKDLRYEFNIRLGSFTEIFNLNWLQEFYEYDFVPQSTHTKMYGSIKLQGTLDGEDRDKYIGVECHPENFEVMKKNLGHLSKFELINAAVTNQDIGEIILYMTGSKQEFCSGTTNPKSNAAKNMRKNKVFVPTVNGHKLFEEYKPTHLKCDIEGEEYRMFDPHWLVPECVKPVSYTHLRAHETRED